MSTDWSKIKYFSKSEWEPSADKVNPELILIMDAMREFARKPIAIHCAYDLSGHANKSQHYLGNAVDFHIMSLPLMEQFLIAEKFRPTGLGLYPYWNTPGLHFDLRPLRPTIVAARWWRDSDGSYHGLNSIKDFLDACDYPSMSY